MEQENSRLIQGVYDAFEQGNIQHILDRVTGDVEWVNEGPESIPYAGRYDGREAVPRFFQALASTTENGRVKADELIAHGDKVVGIGRFTAKVKATGKSIDVPIAHVFTIRGGKIGKWIGYADTARVVEAYTAHGLRAAS